MVRVLPELTLSQDEVTLYYTTDTHLGNLPVYVFHGASTTTNSTLSSSRIQVHVFTAAGPQSYPRITVSPQSPFYQSVNYLPREKQGDEIYRGIAFGLLKYFSELPESVKSGLILQCAHSRGKRPGSAPTLFGEQHAADLAAAMVKVENMPEIVQDIEAALRPQNINHVDLDLVLPPGAISAFQGELEHIEDENLDDEDIIDPTLKQYGSYAPLVKLFGEVTFLPTSKLRRAPSKPTSINRTKSFLKDQKMSLRREMGELVDTEERYVLKVHELVNQLADEYRTKAKQRKAGSPSPTEHDLQKLFPKSLDTILKTNTAFLGAIRKVMDETEDEAMRDLETPIISSTGSRYGGAGRLKDPTGAVAFAKVLLEWFPRFSDCYQEYIRASQDFPHIISTFLKQQSSFSQRLQQTGEQRLRSAIIEPVQRLPRYSLFIDNIVSYLPVTHPALSSMLRARDIITSICSLDPTESDIPQTVNRLRNMVELWPAALHPKGRLITAIDFVELPAPFHLTPSAGQDVSRGGIFLLFADSFVILKKSRECNLSARGVVAEVDKPSAAIMMASVTAAAGGQNHVYELSFGGWHSLADTSLTMSDDGRIVWLTSLRDLKDAGSGRERNLPATVRTFVLQGAYEGKALKFTEEVSKARVEGRFSEAERETDKWSFRSVKLGAASLNLHTAIFEEGIDTLIEGRKEPAPIRIVVDHGKGTKGAPVGHYGVNIVANITALPNTTKYRLEVDGLHDTVFIDEVVLDYLIPTLAQRVVSLLGSQNRTTTPALVSPLTSFYTKILKSMHVVVEGEKPKSFRPASPVKMLSSLLNSGFSSSTSFSNFGSFHSGQPKHQRTPLLSNIPPMTPTQTVSRTNSNKSTLSLQDQEGKASVRSAAEEGMPSNPLMRLEETFTGYIAALQSRKGNIIGRVLRNRATADELAVSALYNTFIENPFDLRAASEVSVDVIFVAFEKYLRMAWKDQMGQVMSLSTLNALQERVLQSLPSDFSDYVRMTFGEMAPQNRRAFIAIIKLLADLLEGCGNDGDRGALTASFAELLVIDGQPHDYINLLDRLVEDSERLFDDIGPGAMPAFGSSTYGSISGSRSNYSAAGSLTSNTSSLRKRFADTILRQNSHKGDSDSRPSMWRTLSKSNRNAATGEQMHSSSLSKASLTRSRSIESPRRPVSRDRPTVLGTFDDRPSSSHTQSSRLSTIGASPPPEEKNEITKSSKKKRRSSLSDLKALMASATLASSPLGPSSPHQTPGSKFNSPRTPSPSKLPVAGGMTDRRGPMYRSGSPTQKENVPLGQGTRNIGNLTERPQNIMTSTTDTVVVKDLWAANKGHSKTNSLSSNIPTLRGTPGPSTSASRLTSSPQKSPQKLRLQSPQKLRERLQNEAKAIGEAEASLQSELSKIGEEMAKLNTASSVRASDLDTLSRKLAALEGRIPEVVKELQSQNEQSKLELEKSLQASEIKVKGLDQLYKESSAENELLYEKFNAELGKIVKALKGKGKEDKEELVGKLKESSEETAKTKKENARLRRELLTLRALLKANE